MSQEDRLGVERVLTQAFSMFTGELKGTYYSLGGMSKEQEDTLQFSEARPCSTARRCRRCTPLAGGTRHLPQ
jgi:hypothetical protein